ncbi:MAG: TolB family protein, partial [Planctomycetota bacterium]
MRNILYLWILILVMAAASYSEDLTSQRNSFRAKWIPILDIEPNEPPTYTLTKSQADETLQRDWLFQAEEEPLHIRAVKEIKWARQLADRLQKLAYSPDLRHELNELKQLHQTLQSHESKQIDEETAENIYLAVRSVKRRIMFRNPVIDFSKLLFIDNPYPTGSEWKHEALHRNGRMAVPGGRLLILDGLHPGGKVRKLAPQKPGSFWRPDISFDAKKVLFCYKSHEDKSFHIYEINIDGTGLKQLTFGDYDDLDPIYLPDGHIMFSTTRCNTYIRCGPYIHSYVLARCDSDGKNVYLISLNNECDWLPTLLDDGRVIYSRWEYTDKSLWRVQSLWTTSQDGTGVSAFWGNQSIWPDHVAEARSIP